MIEVTLQYGHPEKKMWGYDPYNTYWVWNNYPNSAGGVGVQISIKNIGSKTIKYISLYIAAINSVGDVVPSYVKGFKSYGVKFTGPLEPSKTKDKLQCENIWYDTSITSVRIDKAIIEYMDGTSETIPGSEINRVGTYKSVNDNNGGCYVATCVYGSYDCPQVWTLRRYRDVVLSKTFTGRIFVRIYYGISPFFVKHFGRSYLFKKICKYPLDYIVGDLINKGFSSAPYKDKKW